MLVTQGMRFESDSLKVAERIIALEQMLAVMFAELAASACTGMPGWGAQKAFELVIYPDRAFRDSERVEGCPRII
jgi:hypothetical protein